MRKNKYLLFICEALALFLSNSSMYFDEDGDLAHEFYEEEEPPPSRGRHRRGGGVRRMRRVSERRLRPQGEVKYQHPRLHVDFPIIMYQG